MAGSGGLAPRRGMWHGFTARASLSSQGTASSLPKRFTPPHRALGAQRAAAPPRALTVLGPCLYSSL